MGNLSRTPHSEVQTTLNILDHLGVTQEDFAALRTNNGNNQTARAVQQAFSIERSNDRRGFMNNPNPRVAAAIEHFKANFPRRPNESERYDIVTFYLSKVAHHSDLDTFERLRELAKLTVNLHVSDIQRIIVEGIPPRNGNVLVTWELLMESLNILCCGRVDSQ